MPSRAPSSIAEGLSNAIPLEKTLPKSARGPRSLILIGILVLVALLQFFVPLRTAIKIGADEDWELSKATLSLNGYHFYTDVWNDQPLLHTWIITNVLKHVSPSVLGPRLVTSGFALLLITAVFWVGLRLGGVLVAGLAAVLVIASPGFLELSSSCMVEIPALAPAVAALAVLLRSQRSEVRGQRSGVSGQGAKQRLAGYVIAGVLFGISLQIKFINLVLLPIVGLIVWLRKEQRGGTMTPHPNPLPGAERESGRLQHRSAATPHPGPLPSAERERGRLQDRKASTPHPNPLPSAEREGGGLQQRGGAAPHPGPLPRAEREGRRPSLGGFIGALVIFGGSLIVTFVAITFLTGAEAYWVQLKQSWSAHFAATKSFEYGSPADHPFEWSVYLKNWDTTIPALIGILFCLQKQFRRESRPSSEQAAPSPWPSPPVREREMPRLLLVPVVWFALTLVVFGIHKPWWSYYYVHNAVPLCICAAIGIAAVVTWLGRQKKVPLRALAGVAGVIIAGWMGARVYLQIGQIRSSPKIYSSLALKEIERYKPLTKFIYTDEPAYSFHSGIPMPPALAVITLKRLWSGDMTNARIVEELKMAKPGLMLLKNQTAELPFSDWMQTEYRLVYQDGRHNLYAHKSIANKVE